MNKEQIYDEQIFPLMAKIVEICKEHKIATVASFSIPNEEDENLQCDTVLTTEEYDPPEHFVEAVKILRGGSRRMSNLILRTKHADGKETITAFL